MAAGRPRSAKYNQQHQALYVTDLGYGAANQLCPIAIRRAIRETSR